MDFWPLDLGLRGKVDNARVMRHDGKSRGKRIVATDHPDERGIREWCMRYLAQSLDMPVDRIRPDDKFTRLGLDSASALQLVADLEDWLGLQLEPEIIDDHPTIAALARYLLDQQAGGIG